MWDDAKFGIKHSSDFNKIAIADGQNWMRWVSKIAAHLIKCSTKTFKAEEKQDALNWLAN